MQKSRRSVVNFVRTASLSKRYHMKLLLLSLVLLTVSTTYAMHVIKRIAQRMTAAPGFDKMDLGPVYADLNQVGLMFFAMSLFYVFGAVVFVMLMEQRVGRPQVAILKIIEEFKKGNFEARRPLRKDDELKAVMGALEDLAETLKRTHS